MGFVWLYHKNSFTSSDSFCLITSHILIKITECPSFKFEKKSTNIRSSEIEKISKPKSCAKNKSYFVYKFTQNLIANFTEFPLQQKKLYYLILKAIHTGGLGGLSQPSQKSSPPPLEPPQMKWHFVQGSMESCQFWVLVSPLRAVPSFWKVWLRGWSMFCPFAGSKSIYDLF